MTIGRIPSVEGGIQPTIFDAKADILTATAADTPARLAVGSDGDTLVADSAATTGLRWQGNFAAGKNVIINGDFRINQRAFTSNTSSGSYNYDRFWQSNSGGTVTTTPNVFTPGTAPVAGYEGVNYPQIAVTGQSTAAHYAHYSQSIEDCRTLAGQTITISFWAKASSGTPKIGIEWQQFFGSGGSSAVSTPVGAVTLSTSWARYTATISSPSISGKTIGTGSGVNLNLWLSAGSDSATRASSIGIQTATFQIWGVQVEAGSVATAFQTATGTIQGELAACQRCYVLLGNTLNQPMAIGYNYSATLAIFGIHLPVEMRGNPTISSTTGTNYYGFVRNGGTDNFNSFTLDVVGNKFINIYNSTEISGTAGNAGTLVISNSSGFLAAQAEL